MKFNEHWVVEGGSRALNASTVTSDRDIFIVFEGNTLDPDLKQGLLRHFSLLDIEARSASLLREALQTIEHGELSLQQGLPAADYWTLRFVSRLCLGRTLVPWVSIQAETAHARESLRRALLAYHSTLYLNCYQDVYGLFEGFRVDEAALMAGDLISRCIMVANLHFELCDPATKWALIQARRVQNVTTLAASEALVRACRTGASLEGNGLLLACNKLVAHAITSTTASSLAVPMWAHAEGVASFKLPACFCISGFPSFAGAINVIDRSSRYLTLRELRELANSGIL
ncbi:hypothetical protein [Achromobacter spanius]|uniref:hypothetical protein n=1 Tax=Achromobacter spanius TaxID=217203 RepID=UPI00131A34C6|nr:hypothetical protein [Achromobacter spanius]